jgi:acyl-CoA thioesterase FadM
VLLFFRFILAILLSNFRRRVGPLGEARIRFTALPHDCDLNFHLNGGRYVSFMDIARIELMARMRYFRPLIRKGLRPVMGGCVVRFRREVKPFERFTIRSRVVGWDEKWFYIEHIVEKRGGVFSAAGHARLAIVGKSGRVPPAEVLALLDVHDESPALPDLVVKWRELEDAR